jgi:hypothetical protein
MDYRHGLFPTDCRRLPSGSVDRGLSTVDFFGELSVNRPATD